MALVPSLQQLVIQRRTSGFSRSLKDDAWGMEEHYSSIAGKMRQKQE
jgi:hypothetical protein